MFRRPARSTPHLPAASRLIKCRARERLESSLSRRRFCPRRIRAHAEGYSSISRLGAFGRGASPNGGRYALGPYRLSICHVPGA